MSFPRTSTLDRFNRADAPDLGADYSIVLGYDGLPIVSRKCGMGSSPGFQIWSHQRYHINQQVWVVVEDAFVSPATLWLSFRCDSPQPTDGYRCEIGQEGGAMIAHLYRISTDVEIGDSINLGIASFTVGDLVGIDATGYRFTLYYKPFGGAVLGIGQWYNTSVAEYGYIGIGAQATGWNWFSGPWPPPYGDVPPIDAANFDVVYQPDWAAKTRYRRDDAQTYANSLLNIINPGTYDAFAGVAPLFDPDIGWSATGTQYLRTGYIAGSAGQDHAVFVSFSSSPPAQPCEVLGALDGGGVINALLNVNGSNKTWANCSVTGFTNDPGILIEGTMGYSGRRTFADGAYILTLPASVALQTIEQYIMSFNNTGVPFGFPTVTIHAVVYLSAVITDEQAAALSYALDVIRTT